MNLTKIIFILLLIKISFASSFDFSSPIDKFIKTQKQTLQSLNINLIEKSKNDDFNQFNREYFLIISDITPIMNNISPIQLNTLKLLFNNSTFLVKMKFSKSLTYHTNAIKIYLYSLNENAKSILTKDPIAQQLLNYFKTKPIILADIDNFKIVKTKLNNLNINFKNLKIYTKNIFMTNKILNVDKLLLDYINKNELIFKLNNLHYSVNEISNLNLKTNLTTQNVYFNLKNQFNNIKVSFNKIKSNSNVNTLFNNTNIINQFSINNIYIQTNENYIKINNTRINTMILNLDSDILSQDKNLKTYAIKLLNKGFEIKINPLFIQNTEINIDNKKLHIDPILINAEYNIPENDFNQYLNINNILNLIHKKLHIETTQNNINLLSQINPNMFIIISPMIKIINNRVIINIEDKNL